MLILTSWAHFIPQAYYQYALSSHVQSCAYFSLQATGALYQDVRDLNATLTKKQLSIAAKLEWLRRAGMDDESIWVSFQDNLESLKPPLNIISIIGQSTHNNGS